MINNDKKIVTHITGATGKKYQIYTEIYSTVSQRSEVIQCIDGWYSKVKHND